MVNPQTKAKVVHSKSKTAFNIIGCSLGKKHKIAVIPYVAGVAIDRNEAQQHAEFIAHCFNNSDAICAKEVKVLDIEKINKQLMNLTTIDVDLLVFDKKGEIVTNPKLIKEWTKIQETFM